MKLGVDTSFLVRVTMRGCEGHAEALAFLQQEIESGRHQLAIAAPVLPELIHIITDPKRFPNPMTMAQAIAATEYWWAASETTQIHTSAVACEFFLEWMKRFKLGRKRLLDTQLAAIYVAAGISWIVTSDAGHFRIFPGLQPIVPGKMKLPS